MEVDRKTADLKEIEAGVKNKFRWNWLEEKDADGHFLSDNIRKLNVAGQCKCIVCNVIIKYGSSGRKSLVGHGRTENHKQMRRLKETNETLPAMFQATKAMEEGERPSTSSSSCSLPYGAPLNVHDEAMCSGKKGTELKTNVCFADRKANAEAMIVSFQAEHSMKLQLVPHVIKLAQELGKDPAVLQSLSMERTTCSYKLNEGLGNVTLKRIVTDMKSTPFSINIDDESTTKGSNEREPLDPTPHGETASLATLRIFKK